jgi:nucleoside-diphosphate-sugar epimerase
VFGPIIHECTSAKALNTSVGAFYAYLNGAKQDKDAVVGGGAYVDVRDVAQLHIEALVTPEASNKRFLVSNSKHPSL